MLDVATFPQYFDSLDGSRDHITTDGAGPQSCADVLKTGSRHALCHTKKSPEGTLAISLIAPLSAVSVVYWLYSVSLLSFIARETC